jgi:hypothetical protein
MSYHFIDNTPQKHDSIDVQILNEMIQGYKKDGPLAITEEELIDKNKINFVYPKEKHPNKLEPVSVTIETDNESKNLTGYVGDANMNNNSNNTESKNTLKMDGITNFYIGSLTIIGLYLVYRMIQKTR